MPKLGLEPIRRRQLIQATIASIHEDGLADTTVSRISARAGMSPGIVHHYFINKDDLLEATLRSLGVQIRQATRDRLVGVTGPRERLGAIVAAWLGPEQMSPIAVSAWLAFWAQARNQPRLARVQRAIVCRLDSALRHELKQLLPIIDAVRAAEGLSTMLDGLWLRAALSPDRLDAERAMTIAMDYLDLQLSRCREPQPA